MIARVETCCGLRQGHPGKSEREEDDIGEEVMATLEQAGKLVIEQLRERVDQLTEAVTEGSPDFAAIAGLADAVGETADAIGEVYAELEQALRRGLQGESDSEPQEQQQQQQEKPKQQQRSRQSQKRSSSGSSRSQQAAGRSQSSSRGSGQSSGQSRQSQSSSDASRSQSSSRSSGQSSGQSGQSSGDNGSNDETTKVELLERAREVNLPGRSSMSKDELEKAVEAEEQVTKDELLVRDIY
jgi:hypothetical protein